MKVLEAILACAVVGTAWVAAGHIEAPSARVQHEAAGTLRRKLAREVQGTARGAHGTYLDEVLRERDSSIARWPDHVTHPLRVFVSDGGTLDGWNVHYVDAVRDAFETWSQTGIPMRFTYVVDSTMADVRVRFIERFPEGISGKTVWTRDGDHWLLSGDIQLALMHPAGGFVSAGQMRAIALHEVGHLLGLDHSSSPEHIMSARVRVRDLSDGDRATIRLLYSVPAGSLR